MAEMPKSFFNAETLTFPRRNFTIPPACESRALVWIVFLK